MWFVIHRPLMLSVLILSVIGLLVILADKRWAWIEPANVGSLVHSIFGMITIGLAVLQVRHYLANNLSWFGQQQQKQ